VGRLSVGGNADHDTISFLVIINYFYFVRTVYRPEETDSIAIVNADAVLTFAIAAQGF
jgi:hypothetical protein